MRLIAMVMALSFLVAAQGVAGADADKTEARRHFKRGASLIQRGAYEAALTEFLEAYQLFPNERLHYDIAQAYRLMGDKENAVEHYRRYLAAIDVGEMADDARRQLAGLGAAPVAVEPAALEPSPPRPLPEPPAAVVPAPAPAPPEPAVAPPAVVVPAVVAPASQPDREHARAAAHAPSRRRTWVWITVGAVAAAGAAVGLGLGLTFGGHYPQASLGSITVPAK